MGAKGRLVKVSKKAVCNEEVDRLALDNHPVVKIWEEVVPHLLTLNTSYQGMFYDNAH